LQTIARTILTRLKTTPMVMHKAMLAILMMTTTA